MSGRNRSVLSCLLLVISLTAWAADPTFDFKTIAAAGVRDLHFGDFDGDGAPDLAALTDSGIAVFFNDSQANFTRVDLGVSQPTALQIADFNGDQRMDLAVASNQQIHVFRNNGDRTFTALAPFSPPNWQGTEFGAVDLNGDHNADLVLSLVRNVVSVMAGNGDGTFAAAQDVYTVVVPSTASDPGLYTIRSGFLNGDFNGDGRQDIVFAEGPLSVPFGGVNVTVLLNQGGMQFTKSPGTFQEGDFTGASVLDANADGIDDVGFGWLACHTPCTGADVWVGSPNGVMTPLLIVGTSTSRQSLAVSPGAADFNGDGVRDVAFSMGHNEGFTLPAVPAHQSLLIYLGPLKFVQGQGPPTPVDVNLGPVSTQGFFFEQPSMVSADFNLDGKPDAAAIQNDGTGIILALNTTAGNFPAPPRDFALGLSVTSATVTAGQAATSNVSIARLGAFNDSVTFACSGLPANATCTFSPATVKPGSDGHATTTLTVTTKAPGSSAVHPLWPGGTTFAFLVPAFGMVLAGFGRSARGKVLLLLLVVGALLLMQACGGHASPAPTTAVTPPGNGTPPTPPPTPPPATGTPAGTYTIIVTATGAGTPPVVHAQNLTLKVQ